jgi:hypothetical protein
MQTEPDFMPVGRTGVKFFPPWLSSSKESFILTVFTALYASLQPFSDFQKGKKSALTTYHTKAVWPDSTHKVTTDDCLFHFVCTSLSDDQQGFDFSSDLYITGCSMGHREVEQDFPPRSHQSQSSPEI